MVLHACCSKALAFLFGAYFGDVEFDVGRPRADHRSQKVPSALNSSRFSINCMLFWLTVSPVSALIGMNDRARPPRAKQAPQHKTCLEEPRLYTFPEKLASDRGVYNPRRVIHFLALKSNFTFFSDNPSIP